MPLTDCSKNSLGRSPRAMDSAAVGPPMLGRSSARSCGVIQPAIKLVNGLTTTAVSAVRPVLRSTVGAFFRSVPTSSSARGSRAKPDRSSRSFWPGTPFAPDLLSIASTSQLVDFFSGAGVLSTAGRRASACNSGAVSRGKSNVEFPAASRAALIAAKSRFTPASDASASGCDCDGDAGSAAKTAAPHSAHHVENTPRITT